MELRSVATRASKNEKAVRSSPSAARNPAPVEPSLQWVTARIPPALVREIEAHAKRSGTTRPEALRESLAAGIETIQHRDGVPGGRVEEVLGVIESVRLLLELLGPPTFGTQRILAHWATRDRALKVSEEELMAEVRGVSADQWEQVLAAVGKRGNLTARSTLPSGPPSATWQRAGGSSEQQRFGKSSEHGRSGAALRSTSCVVWR